MGALLQALWGWLAALFGLVEPEEETRPLALAAFLAGQSVRQATYLNQGIDPALMQASDWPAAIKITERQIRSYITELEQTIAELETEIDTRDTAQHAQGAEQ